MSSPLISVIMPVFNGGEFIAEAIASVLRQTIEDFEIIVIDDGSTDDTASVVKMNIDPRIRFIRKPINEGVSSAVNIGFKLAKGKYIARMDADDISDPLRFEKQLQVLENNPEIYVCSSWVQYMGGSGEVLQYAEHHNEIMTGLLLKCSICMGAAMFRRIELQEFLYDHHRRSGEDYDFWSRIAWEGQMYIIPEVLLYYRVHVNQISIINKSHQILDDINIRLSMFRKLPFDQRIFDDSTLRKVLLLNEGLTVQEFKTFLSWLRSLKQLNRNLKVFPIKSFEEVLAIMRRTLIFRIYFTNSISGVDRQWRTEVFKDLPVKELLYIMTLKIKEYMKLQIRR